MCWRLNWKYQIPIVQFRWKSCFFTMHWSITYHLLYRSRFHLMIRLYTKLRCHLAHSLRGQYILDDQQYFFKEMSTYIWTFTKFLGLSKINDLKREINQQPTPRHGIREWGAAGSNFIKSSEFSDGGYFLIFHVWTHYCTWQPGSSHTTMNCYWKYRTKKHIEKFYEFAKTSTNLAWHKVLQLFLKLNFNPGSRFSFAILFFKTLVLD